MYEEFPDVVRDGKGSCDGWILVLDLADLFDKRFELHVVVAFSIIFCNFWRSIMAGRRIVLSIDDCVRV